MSTKHTTKQTDTFTDASTKTSTETATKKDGDVDHKPDDLDDHPRPVDPSPGYDAAGYDTDGYDVDGFNRNGFDRDGYDAKGFTNSGYDADGYDHQGYDRRGLDRDGDQRPDDEKIHVDERADGPADPTPTPGGKPEQYDLQGYSRDGFDEDGYDRQGYDREGFADNGVSRDGYRRSTEDDAPDRAADADYDGRAVPDEGPAEVARVKVDQSIEADDPYGIDSPQVDVANTPVTAPDGPITQPHPLDKAETAPKHDTTPADAGAGNGDFGSGAAEPESPIDPNGTPHIDDDADAADDDGDDGDDEQNDLGSNDVGDIEVIDTVITFDDPVSAATELDWESDTPNWFAEISIEASATDPSNAGFDSGDSFDLALD